jgi:hypothetical protein
LTKTKVRTKHKRRYNIKAKQTPTLVVPGTLDAAQEQQSEHISRAQPEESTGQAGENVKTSMTLETHPTSQTRKHKSVLCVSTTPTPTRAKAATFHDIEKRTIKLGCNCKSKITLIVEHIYDTPKQPHHDLIHKI